MRRFGFTLVDILVSLFVVSLTAVMALKSLAAHATFRNHFQNQEALFDDIAFTRFQLHRLMHQSSQIGCRTLDINLPVLNLSSIDIEPYRALEGYYYDAASVSFLTFEQLAAVSIKKNKLIFSDPVHLQSGEHYALADCRQMIIWTRKDIHHVSDIVYNPIPAEMSSISMQENTKLYKMELVSLVYEDQTLWLRSENHKSYKLMSGVKGMVVEPAISGHGIRLDIDREKYPVIYDIKL